MFSGSIQEPVICVYLEETSLLGLKKSEKQLFLLDHRGQMIELQEIRDLNLICSKM